MPEKARPVTSKSKSRSTLLDMGYLWSVQSNKDPRFYLLIYRVRIKSGKKRLHHGQVHDIVYHVCPTFDLSLFTGPNYFQKILLERLNRRLVTKREKAAYIESPARRDGMTKT
ncbi:hypothetical protein RRG08_059437 [Elysia crispata]|uniref:Uncharacterized protein n=1 Tax=Elysia crispata TaxID=231223 RepID=A0AAE1DT80_9GAST|nr:hypothetical protein RRG08_059437 [Elysia crispata]